MKIEGKNRGGEMDDTPVTTACPDVGEWRSVNKKGIRYSLYTFRLPLPICLMSTPRSLVIAM